MGTPDGALPQYQVDKTFADRRYKVQSARTYFYLNEATCERNMETFLKCLEAVSGNLTIFDGVSGQQSRATCSGQWRNTYIIGHNLFRFVLYEFRAN